MVDWLLLWGATQAVGVLVYPILQDLAKEGAKDFAKDFFKDSLKHVLLREKDPRNIAAGNAIREFLQLVQQELKDADVSDAQLQQYTKPLKEFINDKSVKESLGSAFKDDCQALDTKTLAKTWYQLNLSPSLPEEFDWELIGKLYRKKVKSIIRELPELRTVLDSENIESIQQNTKEMVGIAPEFDLRRYQEGLQERYSNLNLDSLDTSVYDYREKLKVWQVFIAQNVRECQEFLPQVYELPKEHQKRLRESNQLEADVDPEAWERYKQVYYQQPVRSVLDVVNEMQSDRLPPQLPLVRGEQDLLSLGKGGEQESLLLGKGKEQDLPLVPALSKGGLGGVNSFRYIVILGDPGSGKSTLLQYIALNWARTPLNTVISQPIPLLIELRSYSRDRISGQCKDFLEFFHKGSVICRLNQHQLHEQLKAGKVLVMFDGLDESWHEVLRLIVGMIDTSFAGEIIDYLMDLDGEVEKFINLFLAAECLLEVRNRSIISATATKLLKHLRSLIRYKERILPSTHEDYLLVYEICTQAVLAIAITWKDDPETLLWLKTCVHSDDSADAQYAAVLALAEGWKDDSETLPWLKTCVRSDDRTLREAAVQALAKGWKDDPDTLACLKVRALEDDDKYVREAAVQALAKGWKDDPDTLACLEVRAVEDENPNVRTAAVQALARGWRDHLNTLSILKNRLEDQQGKVREAAVQALAKGWKDDPDTLACLKVRAVEDDDSNVRAAVAQALARGWRDDPDTLSILRTCLEDQQGKVRAAAVQELARGWKDDPDTLSWLKNCVRSDDDWVRTAAIEELARGWKDDFDTLSTIKTYAQFDRCWYVRRAAVIKLAEDWKNDPETLPILKATTLEDEDEYVRYVALQELARGWKDEPGMFEFLCDRALNDPFERKEDREGNPRQLALEIIIKQYRDYPQTLPLLQDRAENDPDDKVREFAKKKLAELEK